MRGTTSQLLAAEAADGVAWLYQIGPLDLRLARAVSVQRNQTPLTQVKWWPEIRHGRASGQWFRGFFLPLWIPFLLFAIPTGILFYKDRRPPGHCRKCRYDLTGNTSGVCPECGTPVST